MSKRKYLRSDLKVGVLGASRAATSGCVIGAAALVSAALVSMRRWAISATRHHAYRDQPSPPGRRPVTMRPGVREQMPLPRAEVRCARCPILRNFLSSFYAAASRSSSRSIRRLVIYRKRPSPTRSIEEIILKRSPPDAVWRVRRQNFRCARQATQICIGRRSPSVLADPFRYCHADTLSVTRALAAGCQVGRVSKR